jgi:hypothetical protein
MEDHRVTALLESFGKGGKFVPEGQKGHKPSFIKTYLAGIDSVSIEAVTCDEPTGWQIIKTAVNKQFPKVAPNANAVQSSALVAAPPPQNIDGAMVQNVMQLLTNAIQQQTVLLQAVVAKTTTVISCALLRSRLF